MAMKRCPDCGEKYSDTYKYCPFCEEEEILKKGKTGGRRARQERSFSLLTPVLVILILLMAGLLIFLLRGDKQPTAPKDPITPQPGVVTPVTPDTPDTPDTEEPGTDEPDTEDPGVMPDEPDDTTTTTEPNTGSETDDYEKAMALPDGLTLSTSDFTMKSVGETATIRVSGGSGSYTWISEDDGIASVDSTGKVTAISKGTINIVVTDGSKKGVCIVRCNVSGTAAPAAPTTPSTTTNTGNSTSGSLKTGSGVVTNAAGGVNVRPSAGTDGSPIASLKNGDKVQIVSSAGNGWYQITFSGPGGADVTGYMKGDYLTNS